MAFETILREHFARYPSMQIQDVYKLIHQAALGSEHAISNPEGARAWMEHEIEELGEGPNEPVLDPISEDGQIVRVHLRPFLAQGGVPEALLAAFIDTANEHRGEVQLLKDNWKIAVRAGNYPTIEMEDFIQSMQVQDYPAVHHSLEYKRLYCPAYRVICRKFFNTNS
ncbi:MAG TPA: hypothetical protein VK880_07390 [Anaerolineales bacterium]|nr:hypothetical protein [Anaerolineales bacterium]